MSARESTLFATTRWTLVCDAARGGDTGAVEALGALFGTYWPPLYRYVRRQGRTAPDAEYAVQGFFAHLVCRFGNADCAFCRRKGFVPGKKAKAVGLKTNSGLKFKKVISRKLESHQLRASREQLEFHWAYSPRAKLFQGRNENH